jgi:hypothetical protein
VFVYFLKLARRIITGLAAVVLASIIARIVSSSLFIVVCVRAAPVNTMLYFYCSTVMYFKPEFQS